MKIKFLKDVIAINSNLGVSYGTGIDLKQTLARDEDDNPKIFIGCDQAGIYDGLYRIFYANESLDISDYKFEKNTLHFTSMQNITNNAICTDIIDKTSYEITGIDSTYFSID